MNRPIAISTTADWCARLERDLETVQDLQIEQQDKERIQKSLTQQLNFWRSAWDRVEKEMNSIGTVIGKDTDPNVLPFFYCDPVAEKWREWANTEFHTEGNPPWGISVVGEATQTGLTLRVSLHNPKYPFSNDMREYFILPGKGFTKTATRPYG